MSIAFSIFLILFFFLCFVLCFFILLQEGKSSGFGSSFGGGEVHALLGASAGDIIKKITAWLSFIFFFCCLVLNLWTTLLGKERSTVGDQYQKVEDIKEV